MMPRDTSSILNIYTFLFEAPAHVSMFITTMCSFYDEFDEFSIIVEIYCLLSSVNIKGVFFKHFYLKFHTLTIIEVLGVPNSPKVATLYIYYR